MNARRDGFMKATGPQVDGLFGAAMRLTGGRRAEAEDLVQETLLHAYQAWDRFEPGTNVRAWLHRILVNGYISSYRRHKRERRALDLDADPGRRALFLTSAQEAAELPDGGVQPTRLGRAVTSALDELPAEFRAVVVMADLCDMTYREIADALDCPMGTVMSRLHRGRRALARKLGPAMGIAVPEAAAPEASDRRAA